MSGNTRDMAPARNSHAVAWTGLLLSCRFWFGRSRGGAQELAFLTNLDVLVYGPHSEYLCLKGQLIFITMKHNLIFPQLSGKFCIHKGKIKVIWVLKFPFLERAEGLGVRSWLPLQFPSDQTWPRACASPQEGPVFSSVSRDFSYLCLIQAKP